MSPTGLFRPAFGEVAVLVYVYPEPEEPVFSRLERRIDA